MLELNKDVIAFAERLEEIFISCPTIKQLEINYGSVPDVMGAREFFDIKMSQHELDFGKKTAKLKALLKNVILSAGLETGLIKLQVNGVRRAYVSINNEIDNILQKRVFEKGEVINIMTDALQPVIKVSANYTQNLEILRNFHNKVVENPQKAQMNSPIIFVYADEVYMVNARAYEKSLIELPNGVNLSVRAWEDEGVYPPKPLKFKEVSKSTDAVVATLIKSQKKMKY